MQMDNTVAIDLQTTPPRPPSQDPTPNRPKTNSRKRKKDANSPLQNLRSPEEKQAHIETLEKELEGLFGYYRVVMCQKVVIDLKQCGGSRNAVVAALMEESELPLSKLVDEIHGKLNSEVANGGIVLAEGVNSALVKSSVLIVGQRMMYGVPNADADILEDHSDSCLWCWETRDVKLLPKSVRGVLVIRRTCRKKIHERVMAVSEMIASLKKQESESNYSQDLIKASKKLSKTSNEADIRVIVEGLLQKNSEDMDKRKANQEEKLLIKQLDRNRREAEKEKEKESLQCELQTETLPIESNLKLSQGETRTDEKCCEQKKQQKKQVDEAEKDQRRREKEEAELKKKQEKEEAELKKKREKEEAELKKKREKEEAELKKKRSIQKQASIMERFLKRSKPNPSVQKDKVSTEPTSSDLLSTTNEIVSKSATLSMDNVLASSSDIAPEDLRKSHFSSWRSLGQSIRSNRKQRWGLRRNPKTEAFNKLKLTDTKAGIHEDELGMENDGDRLGESSSDGISCSMNAGSTHLDAKKYYRGKQLLQFDNAPRPAFYGFWPVKSHAVGPRHPLRKDPSIDYDVSSDEEWEEEEPGESLSDCEKDEDECLEECSKSDGESEDGFFVPDGYLSEDEGAQLDRMETDVSLDEADSSPCSKDDIETEEFCALLRLQKYLNNLTEHALRKNNPVIITNFGHDKGLSLLDHNTSGTPKQEQMCLQALTMYKIPGSSYIELELSTDQDEDQEASPSTGKGAATPPSDSAAIPDTDLPIIVTTIQSCSQGINKVLGSLQQKFPSASKSSLRNKVREISDYVDNRWQVKKEVLVKLGLPVKPEKSSAGPKSIAAFFSKRCLPPADESVKPGETSPLPSLKSFSGIHDAQDSRSHDI